METAPSVLSRRKRIDLGNAPVKTAPLAVFDLPLNFHPRLQPIFTSFGVGTVGDRSIPRNCAAPRLLRATPGAGNRGSITFYLQPSEALSAPAAVRNGDSPKPRRAGPVSLSLKSGLPRPAHHGACGACMKRRSSAIGRRDSYRKLFALPAGCQSTG
jgi:hypothetical protein